MKDSERINPKINLTNKNNKYLTYYNTPMDSNWLYKTENIDKKEGSFNYTLFFFIPFPRPWKLPSFKQRGKPT